MLQFGPCLHAHPSIISAFLLRASGKNCPGRAKCCAAQDVLARNSITSCSAQLDSWISTSWTSTETALSPKNNWNLVTSAKPPTKHCSRLGLLACNDHSSENVKPQPLFSFGVSDDVISWEPQKRSQFRECKTPNQTLFSFGVSV